MTRFTQLLTRQGWRSPQFFAANTRPLGSALTSDRHLTCRPRRHHAVARKSWPDFATLPPTNHAVCSALWPTSIFFRRKQREKEQKESVTLLSKDLDDLRRKLDWTFDSTKRQIGVMKKQVDNADMRTTEQKTVFTSRWNQVITFERRRLEGEKRLRRQETLTASLRVKIRDLDAQMKGLKDFRERSEGEDKKLKGEIFSLQRDLKKLDLLHEDESRDMMSQMTELELEMSDLRKENSQKHEQIECLQKILGSRIEQMASDDTAQDAAAVRAQREESAEETATDDTSYLVGDLLQSTSAIPYSADKHLKYVQQIEKMFAFKSTDPSLVWQALQYRGSSHKDAEGFNKMLAFEGDAALKLALITKARESENLGNSWPRRSIAILSNQYMVYLSKVIGLTTFMESNLRKLPPDNKGKRPLLGTTIEAIFGVIFIQRGMKALSDTLEYLQYDRPMKGLIREAMRSGSKRRTGPGKEISKEDDQSELQEAISKASERRNAEDHDEIPASQEPSANTESFDARDDIHNGSEFDVTIPESTTDSGTDQPSPFNSFRQEWESHKPSTSTVSAEDSNSTPSTEGSSPTSQHPVQESSSNLFSRAAEFFRGWKTKPMEHKSSEREPQAEVDTCSLPANITTEDWQGHLSEWERRQQAIAKELDHPGDMETKYVLENRFCLEAFDPDAPGNDVTRLLHLELRIIKQYIIKLSAAPDNVSNPYDFAEFAITNILLQHQDPTSRAGKAMASIQEGLKNRQQRTLPLQIRRQMKEVRELEGFAEEFCKILENCRASGDGVSVVESLVSEHLEAMRKDEKYTVALPYSRFERHRRRLASFKLLAALLERCEKWELTAVERLALAPEEEEEDGETQG